MAKLITVLALFILVVAGLTSLDSTQASSPGATTLRTPPVAAAAQRKRALLIGISDYCRADAAPGDCSARGKYWWNLNSAPDVEALKSSLMSKFEFQEGDIKVLTTKAETTHKNIVDTFKSFLIDQTNAGDIVYFHYSGHGGQVPDNKQHGPNQIVGDEIDGLDESLVPSDYKTQQDGSNNIRDDEIGELLAKLKEKAPDSITMTMDSCFSGSNTRGGEHLVRGTNWSGPVPKVDTSLAREDSSSGLLTRGAAAQQGYVIISATSDKQLAGETDCRGKEMGLFTCALVTAFNDAGDNTTYRDVFEKVNDYVLRNARNQSPQLEGARDQRVMKLGASRPQPYVLVDTVGSRIILQAGRLQGMTEGSRFSLHPKGADPRDQKAKAFAQAEISRVDLT
ncbi:MAG: caspase family protein, partial [Acidobacteria bacterium]|nr:caspase family protein [Acidobacteriota bacterium]